MCGGVIRLLSSLLSWKENGTNKFSTVQKYPSPLRRIRDEKMDISLKDIRKGHVSKVNVSEKRRGGDERQSDGSCHMHGRSLVGTVSYHCCGEIYSLLHCCLALLF